MDAIRTQTNPLALRFTHEYTMFVSLVMEKDKNKYSQICPNGHQPLTVIWVTRPLCFCPSAAHFL
jgi:hypothetical protein